jgi:hypothetical protein
MRIKYKSQENWIDKDLKYWKEGKYWLCAVPRDDIATQNGFHCKKYGLIGKGLTKQLAKEDWESWKNASDFVADIY